jgi:Putative binding domain, N-terminal
MKNKIGLRVRLITLTALLAVSLVTLWTSDWSSVSPDIQAKEINRGALQCQIDIYPVTSEVSASPGAEFYFGFGVAAEDGCSWQVQSAPSWVKINSNTNSGTGSGGVAFTVEPNTTGAVRTGVIFLNGNLSHVVNQAAN